MCKDFFQVWHTPDCYEVDQIGNTCDIAVLEDMAKTYLAKAAFFNKLVGVYLGSGCGGDRAFAVGGSEFAEYMSKVQAYYDMYILTAKRIMHIKDGC